MPMAPRISNNWLFQAPTRLTMRWAPRLTLRFVQLNGAGVALAVLAILAEVALQGQEQGDVDDDAVERRR